MGDRVEGACQGSADPSARTRAFAEGQPGGQAPGTEGRADQLRRALHQRLRAVSGTAAMCSATIGSRRYQFPDLATLLAKASPARSGDKLAGIAAESGEERIAAQYALADLP